jgi:hypothetical protein
MEMPGRKYNPQGYRYGFNDPDGNLPPAIAAIIAYLVETGAETGADLALGVVLSYIGGVPYGRWDIAVDYLTNLVPGWGEAKKIKKVGQIGDAIYKIGNKIKGVTGADELIGKASKELRAAYESGFSKGLNDVWGALLELKVFAKMDNLVGLSVKPKKLIDENLLELPQNVLENIRRNFTTKDGMNFEFDGIRKLPNGKFEFIEVAGKGSVEGRSSFSQLIHGDKKYFRGKFEAWKKLQDSGVQAEFKLVVEGATSELQHSLTQEAKKHGINIKTVSE